MQPNRRDGAPGANFSKVAPVALPAVEVVDSLPADAIPAFIAHTAALQARAAVRLGERACEGSGERRDVAPPDSLLTAKQVAERLNAKPDWVYRHWRQIGGQKLDGLLRFPARRVQSYLERQRRTAA